MYSFRCSLSVCRGLWVWNKSWWKFSGIESARKRPESFQKTNFGLDQEIGPDRVELGIQEYCRPPRLVTGHTNNAAFGMSTTAWGQFRPSFQPGITKYFWLKQRELWVWPPLGEVHSGAKGSFDLHRGDIGFDWNIVAESEFLDELFA